MNVAEAPLVAIALPALLVLTACAAPRAVEPRHSGLPIPPNTLESVRTPTTAGNPTLPPSRKPGGEILPLGAAWGASAPVALVAAAPDRRWLALCQAAHDSNGDGALDVIVGPQGTLSGDALEGFYVDREGPGEHIDAFVGSDPTGRFVALVEGGRLLLRDTMTRVDTDLSALGASIEDDRAPFLNPRAGAFAPEGARFLYLRREGDRSRVVVRNLETGAEAVIEAPSGELYRADFDPSGEWVVMRVVTTDTNANGHLEWPVPEAPGPWMRCTGPLPRFAVWERPRDDPATFVAHATGGPTVEAPSLVALFSDAIIERDPDLSLVRVRSDGSRTPFVKKGCEARLLHVDAARGLALVTCVGKKGRNDAVLVGMDTPKPLGLELAASTGDHTFTGTPRLIPLHPGDDAVLVDLDQKDVERLTPGDRIILTAGTRALVLRGHSLLIHERGGHEHPAFGAITPLGHIRKAGTVVVVPPFVVDVAAGEMLGTTPARALAVSIDGAVLVPDGRDADARHLAIGPLRWKRPDPPPVPATPEPARSPVTTAPVGQ